MLERLGDRALRLGECAWRRVGALGERAAERRDHEAVRLLVEREGAGLAGAADNASRGTREADEVLALAARGAARELWGEAGREQELQPEGEGVRTPRTRRFAVEQCELVGEEVVDAGVRLAVVEDAG